MFEKEAEEYANQSYFTEMPNPSLSEDIDISNEIKEAVLYGYNKANEWHCLTKDPNDLPKEQGQYLVLADFYGKYYDVMTESEVKMHSEHIIKWCKLPKE